MAAKDDPSTPSSDHTAMAPYWKLAAAIMGGLRTMRAAGEDYLPKFAAESIESYKRRLAMARMTNIFGDVVNNLAVRPFEQPVQLSENTTEALKEFAEDVDGTGSNLTLFGAKLFRHALEDGVTYVLVDYTKDVPENASIAKEREIGARPFWAEYRAEDVLALYSARVNGKERFTEVRLRETSIERAGFEEKTVERVRVFRHELTAEAPEWELWRKKETVAKPTAGGTGGQNVVGAEWEREDGPNPLDIDVIPLVPVVFGHRQGNGWMVDPPLRDAAYLQLELYQQENGLKNIRNYTAYPMLAANGMDPELGEDGSPKQIVTGPNAVLYGGKSADGGGEWTYVEPNGSSLRFLREDIKDTARDLRELGRQPLSLDTGNLTVIATAAVTQKNNSALQAWAGFLGLALENAFAMTANWLSIDEPEISVTVYADFDLGIGDMAPELIYKLMAEDPPQISREAGLEEFKRRGILGANYDPEADLKLIDRRVEDEPPIAA